MDILLWEGDHQRNEQGFPKTAQGDGEKIQQALIRMTVPRGSFPLDKELGSLLHTLGQASPKELESLAHQYIRQALSGMEGIEVTQTVCKNTAEGELAVQVTLTLNQQAYLFTLPIA